MATGTGRRRIGIVAVAIVGVAALAWLAVEHAPRQQFNRREQATVAPAVAASVQTAPQRTRIEAIGTARAIRSATLFPAAAGQITAIEFKAGEKVKEGQPLLELDARQEKLDVALADVALKNAQQLLARYERIKDTGAVSASSIDSARNDVDSAQIRLNQAQEALRDRTLKAPFSGYVGLTTLDIGDRITTTTQVTGIDDRSVLLIDFQVPETYIERVMIGSPVSLTTTTLEADHVDGEVTAIDSRIDPVTRTVKVRARFDNGDDRFRPGMSFQIAMEFLGKVYPAIPDLALQWGGEGAYVWAIDDGMAKRVPAIVVERRESDILVDADLKAGDLIVVEGVQKMREGIAVRVEETDDPANKDAPLAVIHDDARTG